MHGGGRRAAAGRRHGRDARRGFLFAAQEDVGIWRIPVGGAAFAGPKLIDRVREFGQDYIREFDEEEEEFVCEIDESSPSAGSDYLAADSEDDCDGAMVVGLPMGAFTQGLLVTHDGDEEPGEDATNFKFTRWEAVADLLGLAIDTQTGDPRR